MIRKIEAVAGLLFDVVGRLITWLAVPAHRSRVYRSARVVIPLLVAAGFLTGGTASVVLSVLAALAGFGAPHLAARHTPRRR